MSLCSSNPAGKDTNSQFGERGKGRGRGDGPKLESRPPVGSDRSSCLGFGPQVAEFPRIPLPVESRPRTQRPPDRTPSREAPVNRKSLHLGALAIAASALLLAGCAPATPAADTTPSAGPTAAFPISIENCGTTVSVQKAPERIVTIKSSTTELLLALGLGDRIVGSAFLDGPLPAELARRRLAQRDQRLPARPGGGARPGPRLHLRRLGVQLLGRRRRRARPPRRPRHRHLRLPGRLQGRLHARPARPSSASSTRSPRPGPCSARRMPPPSWSPSRRPRWPRSNPPRAARPRSGIPAEPTRLTSAPASAPRP